MTKLREYNLGHEAISSRVREVLARESASYAGIRMRCVAIEKEGSWGSALCLIEGVPHQSQLQRVASLKYKGVHLLEEWLEPDKLLVVLESIAQGILAIDGQTITLDSQQRFNQWAQVSSQNNYSHFPGHLFTTSNLSNLSFADNGPLLSAGNPFYANPYYAIRDWILLRDFRLSNDARLGTIHLFLPQAKAYFDQITRKGDELNLAVEGSERHGLIVKGAWEFPTSLEQIVVELKGGAGAIPWVGNSEGIELYMIGSDGVVYDFHRETNFWSVNHRRLFSVRYQGSEGSGELEQLLLQGEGEQLEFKPYIRPDHKEKLQEVVRTTIAFANTKGGNILVGVDNACEVVGVEKEVIKAFQVENRELDKAFERYKGTIRQSIANDLSGSLDISMDYVPIQGKKVLRISVSEGEKKPYWHQVTQQIYVRRGANTVKAHPEHDLPALMKSSSIQH